MSTDRDLLFGLLALQAGLIDRAQFIQACTRKEKPLPDVLLEAGWLLPEDRGPVEYLVARRLGKHDGDVQATLAAVRSAGGASEPAEPVGPQTVMERSADGPTLPTTTDDRRRYRDRYALLRLHARGGIGQVWIARDEDIGREVALKELLPERAEHPAVATRFLEEARITGQLEHPGIVPVHELVRDAAGAKPFYTMRFVRGRTLADAVRAYHHQRKAGEAGPLKLRGLLSAFVSVCNAVAYAHSRSVLHRDLKPHNVVLGEFGEVVVLDWGLAKVMGRGDGQSSLQPVALETASAREGTVHGQVLGTPGYMAPEQAEGRLDLLDPRTDVYGLGAVLYQLLTGSTPFEGSDPVDLLHKVVHEQPLAPRYRLPATPTALEAVCQKAMAKRPADRYASAGELAQEIERWLADEPVRARREPWPVRAGRWLRRHQSGVAATAAAVVVALVSLAAATGLLLAANQRERDARTETTRERDEARRQRERADRNLGRARKAVEDYCTHVADDARLKQADFRPLRRQLLETALPFYQDFLEQGSDNPALRQDQWQASLQLGNLRHEMGDLALALAAFEQARTVVAGLAEESPERPEYQVGLLRAQKGIGQLQMDAHRWAEAEASFRLALAVARELASAYPSVAEHQARLVATYLDLAEVYGRSGRLEAAEPPYQQARDTADALVRRHPGVAAHQVTLASVQNALGRFYAQTARNTEAEAAFRQAVAISEELVPGAEAGPGAARNDLGYYLGNLGALYAQMGRTADAEKNLARALALAEKQARDHPSGMEYQDDLARCHESLGELYRDTGQAERAEASYQKALTLRERAAREHPGSPLWQELLAITLHQAGFASHRTGRAEQAEARYRQAQAVRERLVREYPNDLAYAKSLANLYSDLGFHTHEGRGQPEAALAWFTKSIDLLRAALARDDHLLNGRFMLTDAYTGRAAARRALGRHAEALGDYEQAMQTAGGGTPELRLLRAQALAYTGEHARAVAEADVLASAKEASPETLYQAACTCAVASTAPKIDPALARRYADRALALLGRARSAGYFKDRARVEQLKKDEDLTALRGRGDFRKLLEELDGKSGKP